MGVGVGVEMDAGAAAGLGGDMDVGIMSVPRAACRVPHAPSRVPKNWMYAIGVQDARVAI